MFFFAYTNNKIGNIFNIIFTHKVQLIRASEGDELNIWIYSWVKVENFLKPENFAGGLGGR